MKIARWIFIGITFSLTGASADSLLTPTAFPKTFQDVSFGDRMAVLAEGYGVFDRQYDENGKCISGCPYAGITIERDQDNTEQANAHFADLIANADTPDYTTPDANPPVVMPSIPGTNPSVNPGTNPGINPITPPSTTPPTTNPQPPRITRNSLPLRSPLGENKNILVTSDFGFREYSGGKYFHTGIDIGVGTGTPIYATGDGKVTKVTQDKSSGKYVEIQHSGGMNSQYLHLSQQNVHVGDTVRAGDLVGLSGNTGRSTGPHLHYQIYWMNNGEKAFVDILCPCASSYRRNKKADSYTKIGTSQYTCSHSALNHEYCFASGEKEHRVDWRIKSGHCMDGSSRIQRLPDEIAKCK